MKTNRVLSRFRTFCTFTVLLMAAPSWASGPPCTAQAFDKVATFDQEAPAILCAIRHRHLLMVGEVHGTQQIPAFVAQLVRDASKTRPVRLGIEFIHGMQPPITAFMHSKGTQADRDALFRIGYWAEPDGRASKAMKRLIETLQALRAEGRDVDIFTMKPDYPGDAAIAKAGGMQAWVNRGMADAIRKALRDGKPDQLTIAYMGNAHSITAPGDAVPSVTARLTDMHPSLLVLHESGKAMQCHHSRLCDQARARLGPPMHGAHLLRLPPKDGARTIEVRMPHYTSSPTVLAHPPLKGTEAIKSGGKGG